MPKIAIIGAGLIGRAWAMVFARSATGWSIQALPHHPALLGEEGYRLA
ncbi:MAG: 3-hydroxyacyl-CoA dehydrogenase NAD-binding domain-containing protein [Burkholderiales bacterium]